MYSKFVQINFSHTQQQTLPINRKEKKRFYDFDNVYIRYGTQVDMGNDYCCLLLESNRASCMKALIQLIRLKIKFFFSNRIKNLRSLTSLCFFQFKRDLFGVVVRSQMNNFTAHFFISSNISGKYNVYKMRTSSSKDNILICFPDKSLCIFFLYSVF